jgi:hypothetical protein
MGDRPEDRLGTMILVDKIVGNLNDRAKNSTHVRANVESGVKFMRLQIEPKSLQEHEQRLSWIDENLLPLHRRTEGSRHPCVLFSQTDG